MRKKDEVTKELLENILASMEGGIFTIDKNARITTFNRAAEEITGFKKEEVLNKECCDILKSDLCNEACPLKEILETGKTIFNYEIMITSKTGNKIPVNITTSPLRSSNNEIIGAVENFRDLTKHKGLWARLHQERNRAQQYLNIAGVIIVAINDKGVVTLINKKGCDVLGYKEEDIIGKNWFDLCVPERARKERKETFKKVMAGKKEEVEDYENSIVTISGEERIISWHNTTLRDEKGHIIGTLSSGGDITKRKQTEVELIRSEKLASLGQLAASVAHEVNNPLAGILIYTTLLLKKHKEKKLQVEETGNQLLKMKKELERTSRIIRNLLDFSRQSDPTIRQIDLNKVVEAALLLVRHQISLENIRLEMKLGEKLPLVRADFDQIQQVLMNIILNATQAMPEGGTLTIATSVAKGVKIGKSSKKTVRIDIKDTGVGIDEENLSRLFTPFFTTKEKGKGVGLGLPVVHGIIERHKGKIEVASEANVGTTFTIYLEVMDGEKDKNTRCG
ncbi:MAG: PAS domain S-box protein [Candidatus Aminicenantes bacterium]|nr:PAS domain S-box protein [Candidatus Aminicenantes bacterium]